MAMVIAEIAGRAAKHELSSMGDPEHRERRKKQLKSAMGIGAVGLVVAGCGWYGWQDGWATGFANGAELHTETTVSGGTAKITKINLDFKETCWTASTIRVENSSAKIANKIGDWEVMWRQAAASFDAEAKFCIDPSNVSAEKNQATQKITVNVDDPKSIYTDVNTVPGSLFADYTGAPINQLGGAFSDVMKSAPLIKDLGLMKDVAHGKSAEDSALENYAVLTGLYNAGNNCRPTIWSRVMPAVERGLQNIVMPGQRLDHPDLQYSDITVKIGGVAIGDVDPSSIGVMSSIDKQYEALSGNKSMQINQGNQGTCVESKVMETVSTVTAATQEEGK